MDTELRRVYVEGASSTDGYVMWEACCHDWTLPGMVEVMSYGDGPLECLHRLRRNLEDLGFPGRPRVVVLSDYTRHMP